MSILALAESDLGLTLESPEDYGRSISLEDPSGNTATLDGQYGDIGQIMSLLEGEIPVGAFKQHIVLRISSIVAAGLDRPEAVQDTNKNPWKINVTDINGDTKQYKFMMTFPDNTLGVVAGQLENLENG